MKRLLRLSLFQNSLYLLLATGLTAFFSFLFWILASRLFSPTDVGLATTIIVVMNMIAMLSLVGFDTVIIRFLPSASRKNTLISTGLVVVGIATIVLAASFLLFVDHISPALSFIRQGVLYPLSFILFTLLAGLNALCDSIFLAKKATKMTFVINSTFTAARLLFIYLFRDSGATGIYLAVGLSHVLGIVLNMSVLMRRFSFTLERTLDKNIINEFKGYSLGNYIAGILNLLPGSILPIIITNNLGADKAAFYGIAMMIGNLLYTIPWMITRSLFAEGAHDTQTFGTHLRHALILIAGLLLPSMLILLFAGDLILSIFGAAYAKEGFTLLRIIVLAGIFVASTSLIETYFRVHGDPRWLILSYASYLTVIVVCAFLFLPLGLAGIGCASLLGYASASAVSYSVILYLRRRRV